MSSEKVADLGHGIELWKGHPDELREQDENARVMPKAMFDRLAATVGRDNRLESLPFVAKTQKGMEIVSGHHRTRAARAAGVKEIFWLLDVTGLTRDQIKAKQLAHNAIAGEDDKEILKRLYTSIDDVNARLEAFIDEASIEAELAHFTVPNLDMGLEYRIAILTFLPYEHERFEAALTKLTEQVKLDGDARYLLELEMLDAWKSVMGRVGQEYDVRAAGTVLARMAAIVLEHLGEPVDSAGEDEWVPLRDLFGAALIPPDSAAVIKKAIAKMVKDDDVSGRAKWQAVEHWAADYLSGA